MAHECLAVAGAHWRKYLVGQEEQRAVAAAEAALPTPPPCAEGGPEAGTLASEAVLSMVVHYLPAMMDHLLASVAHWTVAERQRGFATLALVVRVVRGVPSALAPCLPRVVDAIASAVVDDEQEVSTSRQAAGPGLVAAVASERLSD